MGWTEAFGVAPAGAGCGRSSWLSVSARGRRGRRGMRRRIARTVTDRQPRRARPREEREATAPAEEVVDHPARRDDPYADLASHHGQYMVRGSHDAGDRRVECLRGYR